MTRKSLYINIFLISSSFASGGEIQNPVAFLRSKSADSPVPAVIKWGADLNSDGKPEVFLSRKYDYDKDVESGEAPGWFVYTSNPENNKFEEILGIADHGKDGISVSLPIVDTAECFVGMVDTLGKQAIVIQQIDNPHAGEPVARIYAYTVEDDHLKRTKLAEYNPKKENAIYNKYLKEGKRSAIILTEIAP